MNRCVSNKYPLTSFTLTLERLLTNLLLYPSWAVVVWMAGQLDKYQTSWMIRLSMSLSILILVTGGVPQESVQGSVYLPLLKDCPMVKAGALSLWGETERSNHIQPLKEGPNHIPELLQVVPWGDEARLFTMAYGRRIRANGHILKWERFRMVIRINFHHWNSRAVGQVSQRGCAVPSLWVFKA